MPEGLRVAVGCEKGAQDAGDAEAIRACLAGEPDPFLKRFLPFIAQVLRDVGVRAADLEEMRQEVLLALLQNGTRRLRAFDPAKGSAASWVARIARQVTSKRRTRDARPPPRSAGTMEPLTPADEAERREECQRLADALLSLPAREGLCLALLLEQGLPAIEAAEILRVEPASVYAIRDRALERLREILGKSDFQP